MSPEGQSATSAIPDEITDRLARMENALARVEYMLGIPRCPDCGGPMWDARAKKAKGEFKPTSPDFSCKARKETGCNGAIWLPKAES